MNQLERNQIEPNRKPAERLFSMSRPVTDAQPSDHPTAHEASSDMIAELKAENRRLLVLVAELLIKNQELRKGHCSESPQLS